MEPDRSELRVKCSFRALCWCWTHTQEENEIIISVLEICIEIPENDTMYLHVVTPGPYKYFWEARERYVGAFELCVHMQQPTLIGCIAAPHTAALQPFTATSDSKVGIGKGLSVKPKV